VHVFEATSKMEPEQQLFKLWSRNQFGIS